MGKSILEMNLKEKKAARVGRNDYRRLRDARHQEDITMLILMIATFGSIIYSLNSLG
jgi:hypothetical protein|tara:strand:+ start:492 stop:662 length:171 start_codon:yes stop_codon:yes gene_type:complete